MGNSVGTSKTVRIEAWRDLVLVLMDDFIHGEFLNERSRATYVGGQLLNIPRSAGTAGSGQVQDSET